MGRLEEAERACNEYLLVRPMDANAHHLLGTILHQRGQNESALLSLLKSVELAPDTPGYRVNLAAILGNLGRDEESLAHLQVALRQASHLPELHNNLGVTLEKLGRLSEAASAFREALRLRPEFAEGHFNLGNVQRKKGNYKSAINYYHEAARLRPEYRKPLDALGGCWTELGAAKEAIECYRRVMNLVPGEPSVRSGLLYTLHYHPDYDAAALAHEHREWGRLFDGAVLEGDSVYLNDRSATRRIRVGYVSPDFREHTPPRFIGAAFRHHDRSKFEVHCYSDVLKPDVITERLKGMVEHWHDVVGWPDAKLEALIREHRIDILVDLRGHAASNRLTLFARRPAPVQVNMVGYFNTTGLPSMSYRITDGHQDPTGETEQHHTERLVRLEPSCWCYTPDVDAPEVAATPMLARGHVTFGSLNKIIKVSEPCAKTWGLLMKEVPGSRLLLPVPGADGNGDAREIVLERLDRWGFPIDRIDICDKTDTRREYLDRFAEIDVALDTWPFNGITTTCDGLWMGVPAVSLSGHTSVSRAGKSILVAAGLEHLAVKSPEEFVKVAAELVADPSELSALRGGMRDRLARSALLDHQGFTIRLEFAFRTMWEDRKSSKSTSGPFSRFTTTDQANS